jgi:hypothetical protein
MIPIVTDIFTGVSENIFLYAGAACSAGFILCYDGSHGAETATPKQKNTLRNAFYWYYPAHLAVLAAVRILVL